MKKIKGKYIVVILLLLMEFISLTLMYKSSHNKEVVLDEVKLKELIKNDMISIMTDETGNGTYIEYSGNTFPSSGYVYNASKSQCINEKGDIVTGVLTYNGTKASLTSNEGMHCTLYFDKNCSGPTGTVLSGKAGISNCQVGGMYRYQGTNVNNYICFGTNTSSKCTSNSSTYMYRIIGVTPDNHLKIMKENDLGKLYWLTDTTQVIQRGDNFYKSNLNSQLNGTKFLTNSTYVPSGWSSKIFAYNYYNGYSNNFDLIDAETIYKIETGKEVIGDVVGDGNGHPTQGSGPAWEANTFKIGLPYVHDYLYSIANNTSNCSSNSCTSWMTYSNNYATMSVCGARGDGLPCGIYYIDKSSKISYMNTIPEVNYPNHWTIKPSFYLTADTTFQSGSGTKTSPYIIAGMPEEVPDPPVVTDSYPTIDTLTVSDRTTVSFIIHVTASDDKGITKYCFKVGSNSETCFNSTAKSYDYTVQGLKPNTSYDVTVKVYDTINQTRSKTTSFSTGELSCKFKPSLHYNGYDSMRVTYNLTTVNGKTYTVKNPSNQSSTGSFTNNAATLYYNNPSTGYVTDLADSLVGKYTAEIKDSSGNTASCSITLSKTGKTGRWVLYSYQGGGASSGSAGCTDPNGCGSYSETEIAVYDTYSECVKYTGGTSTESGGVTSAQGKGCKEEIGCKDEKITSGTYTLCYTLD